MKRMLLSLAMVFGCTGCHLRQEKGYAQDYHQEPYQQQMMMEYAEAAPEPSMDYAMGVTSAARVNNAPPAPSSTISNKLSAKGKNNQGKDDKSDRMIHYNGSATLLVSRLPETLDRLEEIAVKNGGGLIARGANHIMLQVPRKNFDQAYTAALELGEVLYKNISTTDVTEAFTDTALRLEAMKTTRDRLIELLAKTKDEAEKVRILQQIQRLSEEIDSKEAQLRGLKNLANYSNITIQLELRQAGNIRNHSAEISGFQWINGLSPFEGYGLHAWKKIKLDSPEGMVVLEPKGHYHAESADKANVFAGRIPNDPQGNSAFWKDAIVKRIGGEYTDVDHFEAGEYLGIRFRSDDEQPYIWTIFLKADGRWLNVIQAYYPTEEHEQRLSSGVQAIVSGGAE